MNGSSRSTMGQFKLFHFQMSFFIFGGGEFGDEHRISSPFFSTKVPLFTGCFSYVAFSRTLKINKYFKIVLSFTSFPFFLTDLKLFTALVTIGLKLHSSDMPEFGGGAWGSLAAEPMAANQLIDREI